MVKPERDVSLSNEFFKVYLSDFSSRQLSLPPAFGIQFNGKNETLPKNATLKDGNGKIWQVGLEKEERDWIIKDGWKDFACYNSLVDGDFLIFKYDGSSHFDVELYGNNGLKNEGRGIENRPSIHVKEEGLIVSRPGNGYKETNSDIEPRRTRSQAKLGEFKGVKTPSSVPGKVPSFVVNITRTTRCARIPKTIMREHNIELPKEMKLRDESGKLWPVQASLCNDGYTLLTRGLSEFCKMKKLVPRDQIILTIIRKGGNLCNIIQVQIVRQGSRAGKRNRLGS